MSRIVKSWRSRRAPHYAWVVLGVTGLSILMASGVTALPPVLIHPLETEFGWDRAQLGLAVAINVLVYGLAAPFAGRLMLRFGPRRVMLASLTLVTVGVAATSQLYSLAQLYALWGVVVGIGAGGTALVLGATVVNRWFATQRGLALGLLGAASSTGRLVFLPLLAALVVTHGWQSAVWLTAACMGLLVLPLVAAVMRDAPAQVGLAPYGAAGGAFASTATSDADERSVPLPRALRDRDFWRLWLSFAICGATTNGLIGTHLIPHAIDQGIAEVAAAGTLALMGVLDVAGTIGSGWLSDRFDKRLLLAIYYGLRGLSLLFLPFAGDIPRLALFGVVYGLDWIATVPPTAALASELFGKRSGPILFGWIFFGHQVGAALAAYGGGLARVWFGDYHLAFTTAGIFALLAAALVLTIGRGGTPLSARAMPRTTAAVSPGG
jgi:MFS family permease